MSSKHVLAKRLQSQRSDRWAKPE